MRRTSNLIQFATIITLAGVSMSASAEAIQWTEAEGGNGHWYGTLSDGDLSWTGRSIACEAVGGHLATFTTPEEQSFALNELAIGSESVWIGGYQDVDAPDYDEPTGGWRWVTEEPFQGFGWTSNSPDDFGNSEHSLEWTPSWGGGWNDLAGEAARIGVVEWSADCNGDGIVDYGQILDGTYADDDGNGVPDCCDAGEPCDIDSGVIGPIRWDVADGGNGHWYQLVYNNEPLDADDRFVLDRLGAHEATLVSQAELDWVWDNLASLPQAWREDGGSLVGPRIGLGNYCLSNFHWVTAEPVSFTNWGPGEPSSNCGYSIFYVNNAADGVQPTWAMSANTPAPSTILLEWDNDCDGNGLIDFGEILDGTASDADGNGIPDHCEAPKKWPTSEGGNGHWYQYITQDLWTYEEGQAHAVAMGAHLASIADASEDGFVDQRIADVCQAFDQDPFIGADRLSGPWQWLTGEPWTYSDWSNGTPYSWCCDALTIMGRPPTPMLRWGNQETSGPRPILIEWDADCNGDGIVDYGQILAGALDDADGNGVPDCCDDDVPCFPCPADFMNSDGEVGVDELLFIISAWGTDNETADLDGDGWVDVHDVLMVLDAWGPCPEGF